MADISGSLMGLSLLTGNGSLFSSTAAPAIESKAVRVAKAQFTTQPTTPPWKEAANTAPIASQVSAVQAMKTIIDKAVTGANTLPTDVQTAFTTYKALDRLRLLADAASSGTASNAQRATLQKSFAKGMADLQSFLGTAPSDLVKLSFGQPARMVKSTGIPDPMQYEIAGKGLVKNRTDAIPGLTGQEVFKISLSKPGASDEVTVDLSGGPQPPTIDSVAAAINGAIQSVQLRNPDGSVRLDENGNPIPRYLSHFVPDKSTDKWGFKLDSPSGVERVSIDQVNAKDAIVVATGRTALDAPTATTVFRYDDPTGSMTPKAMGEVKALDRIATERATLMNKTTETITTVSTDYDGKSTTNTVKTSNVYANTDAASIVTDRQGNSYVVGTTTGDLGSNLSDGDPNLFLTKLDGEGNVVWQRSLGAAGSSQGAALSLTNDGKIVVAGTVNGSFQGTSTDGDLLVARYDATGNEDFATVVHKSGSDTAKAVAVGADGSIYVGGKSQGDTSDAFVAKLDAAGHVVGKRTIGGNGSESITGLAVDGSGNLLALMNQDGTAQVRRMDSTLANDLGSLSIGTADARAIAVGADGGIVVGGATAATLNGTQANARSDGRDGFVARIDGGLSQLSVSYLGSTGDDQVDSIAIHDGEIYAGGRTTGALGDARKGAVDGFVGRIDATSGAVQNVTQFGASALRTEPVRVAYDQGGSNAISALGFARGTINPEVSTKLVSQTALRPGDNFAIKIDGGASRTITIAADDTMDTLAARINGMLGSRGKVTSSRVDDQRSLRFDPKAGHSIELVAGSSGQDALAKLGIEPQRVDVPLPKASNAPVVSPGGTFGLALSDVLDVSSLDNAKFALGKINEALSMSQTAYRSLYWDDSKAILVDNYGKSTKTGTASTARETAQLKNYQAALTRLSAGPSSTIGF